MLVNSGPFCPYSLQVDPKHHPRCSARGNVHPRAVEAGKFGKCYLQSKASGDRPVLGRCCNVKIVQRMNELVRSVTSSSRNDAYWRALRLLEANPKINQRELAAALGMSLGKTNYCLKALLGKGLLKIQNFQSSKRKLAYAYVLTPAGLREKTSMTIDFLRYKQDEYAALQVEIQLLQREVGDLMDSSELPT